MMDKSVIWDVRFYEILGVNGVAMARNGPILGQNDATSSRKVFRYLPGLWDIIQTKKSAKVQKTKKCNILQYF